jgi:hypothetical protein
MKILIYFLMAVIFILNMTCVSTQKILIPAFKPVNVDNNIVKALWEKYQSFPLFSLEFEETQIKVYVGNSAIISNFQTDNIQESPNELTLAIQLSVENPTESTLELLLTDIEIIDSAKKFWPFVQYTCRDKMINTDPENEKPGYKFTMHNPDASIYAVTKKDNNENIALSTVYKHENRTWDVVFNTTYKSIEELPNSIEIYLELLINGNKQGRKVKFERIQW